MAKTPEEIRAATRERVRRCRERHPELERARDARKCINVLKREGYTIIAPENPIHELYADKRGRA